MSLRSQFLLVMLGVGLLPLLILGLVLFQLSSQRLQKESEANLTTFNELTARRLDLYLTNVTERIRARAVQRDTAQFFEPEKLAGLLSSPANPEIKRHLLTVLDGFHNIDPVNIVSVALLDKAGIKLADTDARLQNENEGTREWFTAPFASGVPTAVVDIDAKGSYLRIGTPVRNTSGAICGVLRARIQLSVLQQFLRELSPDLATFAVVCDRDGYILAHGLAPESVGKKAKPISFGGHANPTFLGTAKGWEIPFTEGCLVAARDLERVPWMLAVFQGAETFNRGRHELEHFVWLSGGAALFLCGLGALLASFLLSKRVVGMATIASSVHSDHLNERFPEKGPREVKQLAIAFNAMKDRLSASLNELAAKNNALEEKERRLRDQISLNPVAVVMAESSRRITQINSAFTALLGYTLEDFSTVEELFEKLIPDAGARQTFRENLARVTLASVDPNVIVAGIEHEVLAKDGTTRTLDFRSRIVGPRYFVVLLDLTERRHAETEIMRLNLELEHRVAARTLQLANANAELESFSYAVSHDLRSPLRAMDGFSRALEEDYADKLDSDAKDFIKRIRAASQRMGLLIDDLLKLARVSRSELKRENVDLSALAATVFQRVRHDDESRQVTFQCTPGMVASCDRSLVQIALENLLQNAFKYTRKKPDTQIEFGCKTDKHDDGSLDITYFVKDNGAGFDMRYAGKLFGAFQRLHSATEFEGTGVGLATVRRIISRHGGRIWAQAQLNQGAAFYFTIPSADSGNPFFSKSHSRSPFTHPTP